MRVSITGVAGFIGSSVAEALLARGDQVVGIDSFETLLYGRAAKERNLQQLLNHPDFSFVEGSILEEDKLEQALQSDRVIHLAALAGVRPSIANPARYMRTNVEGTVNVLEVCRRRGIRRVVVASSSSVYGARSQTPFSEHDPCDRPASPYAASKKATEIVCSNYVDLYGMGVSCLRFFTVYGPRQRPDMAIHKFVALAVRGEPIPMFGDGSSGRDYTYVDDIVAGTIAALDRQDGAFHVYNLGGSKPLLLRELISEIEVAVGRSVQIAQQPWQSGDVPITCADVSLAEKELGFSPQVGISEGLRRFVAWYRGLDPAQA